MDLQSVFYIVGIVAMILFIILTLLTIFLVFFIKKVISDTQKKVVGKIMEYTKPVDVFKGLAGSIVGNIFLKVKDNFGLK